MPCVHSNFLKKAFSLIEAAIVLGVVGLVIGGIWVAAATVNERQKINATTQNIGFIVNAARSLYKGMPIPSTTTGITSLLIASGAIPADMVDNSAAKSAWGGNFTVTIMTLPTSLRFIVYSVPPSACTKVIAGLLTNIDANTGYAAQGLMYAMIDTNNIPPGTSMDTIATRCAANTGGTIRFYYAFPE